MLCCRCSGLVLIILALIPIASPAQKPSRQDLFGDPLPAGVLARMGSARFRPGYSSAIAFSPDGRSLITSNGFLRLWDVATGKPNLQVELGAYSVHAFAISREGMVLASYGNDGFVTQTLDLRTGKLQPRFTPKEPLRTGQVCLSPNGEHLAIGHHNQVHVLDSSTGVEICHFGVPGRAIPELNFSQDGKRLASCDYTDVYVFDAHDGKRLLQLPHARDMFVRTAKFSPDGRWLASITITRQKAPEPFAEVAIWDLSTGKVRHRVTVPTDRLYYLAFSPDSRLFTASGLLDDVILWDVETGKEVRRCHGSWFQGSIAFSPDGKTLAASGSTAILLWDTATGRLLPISADPFLIRAVKLRFETDGRTLLGLGDMHGWFAWDSWTGRELHRYPRVPNACWHLALSSAGTRLASAERDGTLHLWDAATGREVRAWKGHTGFVSYLLFSPAGRQLYSSASDGTIGIWETATGRAVFRLGPAPRLAEEMAVSPDGCWLAFAGSTSTFGSHEAVLWDLRTGREKLRLDWGRRESVMQFAFSPDSRLLAAVGRYERAGEYGLLRVWDTSSGRQQALNIRQKTDLMSVVFAPDGHTLATGDWHGRVVLWEVASGRQRGTLIGHKQTILSLAFAPDGRRLAASSPEAPVYIWDLTEIP
jgi:WD40 repeat protein